MAEFNPQDLKKYDSKKQISRHGKFKIIITILLALILLLLLWGAVYTTADVNSYRIVVSGKRDGSLSLSFDKNFGEGFSVLKGLGVQNSNMADGTGYSEGIGEYVKKVASGEIPMEVSKNNQEGKAAANGGDQFIASKYYIKNTSDSNSVKYKIRINILENKKNAFSASRFIIYHDTEGSTVQTVYAQPALGGSSEKVATLYRGGDRYVKNPNNPDLDWECFNFVQNDSGEWYYDSYDIDGIYYELGPEEVCGYCSCVWYEGSDPEHNNNILGGYISFNITFTEIDV